VLTIEERIQQAMYWANVFVREAASVRRASGDEWSDPRLKRGSEDALMSQAEDLAQQVKALKAGPPGQQ
jgi:hypothetical protein